MDQMNKDTININLKELTYMLIHYLWLILIVGILGAAVMWSVSSYVIKPVYVSSAKVYVINRQDENKITYSDLQTGTQLTKDYMILIKSRPVIEKVIQKLNLLLTYEELSELIEVNIPLDTRILEISVKNGDPTMAKNIADAIAEVSAEQMVNVMELEKVNIVEQGNLPDQPDGPHIRTNTFLGAAVGTLLTALMIIVSSYMNDSIKTSEDIERYLSLTILGTIPLEEEGYRRQRWYQKRSRNKSWGRKKTVLQM